MIETIIDIDIYIYVYKVVRLKKGFLTHVLIAIFHFTSAFGENR